METMSSCDLNSLVIKRIFCLLSFIIYFYESRSRNVIRFSKSLLKGIFLTNSSKLILDNNTCKILYIY